MDQIFKNQTTSILGVCITILVVLSFVLLKPNVAGDGVSYLQAIDFLNGQPVAFEDVAHRVITTFGALELIRFLAKIFGSLTSVWIGLNSTLFVLTVFAFYKMVANFSTDSKVALWASLFLAGNYAVLNFGLNFLMDMGGWAFYIFSLYFAWRFLQSSDQKDILLASLMVGLGGLFKEYAFLGALVIAGCLIYKNKNSLSSLIKHSVLPVLIALGPAVLVYLSVYTQFGYTYLDWLSTNQVTYEYSSRLIEYIKSFGSLINILAILALVGVWFLVHEWRMLAEPKKVFLISTLVSVLPIFAWPAITQRVLFVFVPFIILLATFGIKRMSPKTILPILAGYIALSFLMDSFVLNFVNLPI